MSLKIKLFPVNAFREVTYVVSDESGEAIIIDAGALEQDEINKICNYIEQKELTVKMLVNTHGHLDHIFGVEALKAEFNAPWGISSKEQMLLERAPQSAIMFGLDPSDITVPTIDFDLETMDEIKFGNTTMQVIKTPGHSLGGVCFYEPQEKIMFTGDTLFQGSIGRTDLPGGSYDELMGSIITKILPLGGDVTVYPGHGNHSTLAHEAAYNPFISEVLQGQANYAK